MALRTMFSTALRSSAGSPLMNTSVSPSKSISPSCWRLRSARPPERLRQLHSAKAVPAWASAGRFPGAPRLESSPASSRAGWCPARCDPAFPRARGLGITGQRQGKPDTRDGRTQLMRDAAEQVALALDLVAQLPRHGVEIAHQFGDLVATVPDVSPNANVKIAARQLVRRLAQPLNRLAQVMRDDQAKERGNDGAQLQGPQNIAGHALGERRRNEFRDQQISRVRSADSGNGYGDVVGTRESVAFVGPASAVPRMSSGSGTATQFLALLVQQPKCSAAVQRHPVEQCRERRRLPPFS